MKIAGSIWKFAVKHPVLAGVMLACFSALALCACVPLSGNKALYAAAIAINYLLFCLLSRTHFRQKITPDAVDSIVAFASQSGYAEQLAQQTVASLQQGGMRVALLPLNQLDAPQLQSATRILFVISTTGDGDAPDNATRFCTEIMSKSLMLSQLQFGMLALGDRSYPQFCGFGIALEHWLRHQGAHPLFDSILLDKVDEGGLRHWQYHLGLCTGHSDLPDWISPTYQSWTLLERVHLNPGSQGQPLFHLRLQSADAAVWQAGDIAEIGPGNSDAEIASFLHALDQHDASFADALRYRDLDAAAIPALRKVSPDALLQQIATLPLHAHRAYSIASIPQQGSLDLVVRQVSHGSPSDTKLGLGSGWLTQHAAAGSAVQLRIRSNTGFHPPNNDRPFILIGNGSGIAGLRAHLQARIAAGHQRNWLIYGERNQASDFVFEDELRRMQADGNLLQLDLAFSRDQAQRIYVQHRVMQQAETLRNWVQQGAAIYVCGSLHGMATEVEQALLAILGSSTLEQLADEGRYRRDVY